MAVDDSYTKSLFHFDGDNDSTTVTDESGKAWTRYGNTCLKTATKKFGSASLYCAGDGNNLISEASTDFAMSTGDFTIDFWYKSAGSAGNTPGVINNSVGGWAANAFSLHSSHTSYAGCGNKFSLWVNNHSAVAPLLISSTATNTDTWMHVAVVRCGNRWSLYINGLLDASAVSAASFNGTSSQAWRVGHNDTAFTGYIDELRISKGIARFGSFTSPTEPYPITVAPATSSTARKRILSGCVDGKGVEIAAVSTPGTTVHTSVDSATVGTYDEVWLWAQNNHTTSVLLTIEWGSDDHAANVVVSIPAKSGLFPVAPGLPLQGASVIKAFAGTASVVTLHGFVNTITD